jgi:serine/threonine protein kinase
MAKITRKYCPRCFEAYEDGRDSCPDHELKLVALAGSGEDLEGKIVDDKYEIVDVLGKGGMGTVYRARHMVIGREVALKVLRKDYLEDHKGVARFVREAKAASLLKSRYSAMLHDFGLAPEGFLYYTMELASGRLLSDIVDRDGALGPERTMHIAADICHSLAEAHANNIVHRDIKGDNIMVSEDSDGHEIGKVLDFGTAKLIDTTERSSRVTDPGIVCGTPEYMSPEQAQALPVDGRSDLYSLGVLMFELLTGRLPFVGTNSIAVLMKHVNDEPPRPRDLVDGLYVSEGLENLILRLLSKSPTDRPRSAVVVLRELQKLLEQRGERTGSNSDLSGHESFALDQHVEEAYQAPRGNTLIEMMDPASLQKVSAPTPNTGRNTMELSPGQLWHEKEDDGRSTTDKELQMVDTVRSMEKESTDPRIGPGIDDEDTVQGTTRSGAEVTPSAAGSGKLRELPGDVLRGVEAAASQVGPKRRMAPSLLALVVGGMLGGAVLLVLVLGGFFELDKEVGGGESALVVVDGLPSDVLVGIDSASLSPDIAVAPEVQEFDDSARYAGPAEALSTLVAADIDRADPVADAQLVVPLDIVSEATLVDVVTHADQHSGDEPDLARDVRADMVPLDTELGSPGADVVDAYQGPEAKGSADNVDDALSGGQVVLDSVDSSDVKRRPDRGETSRKERKEKSARKRQREALKKEKGSKGGPVEFTLDDLQ